MVGDERVSEALEVMAEIESASYRTILDSGAFSFMKKRERLGIKGVTWEFMTEYVSGIQKYIQDGRNIYITPAVFEEQKRRILGFPEGQPFASAISQLLIDMKTFERIITAPIIPEYEQIEIVLAEAGKDQELSPSDYEVWSTALCTGMKYQQPVALLTDDGGIACAHAIVQERSPSTIQYTTLYDRSCGGAFGTPFMKLTRERLIEKMVERPKGRRESAHGTQIY